MSAIFYIRALLFLGIFKLALTPVVFAGPLDNFFTSGSVANLSASDFRLALSFWVFLGIALVFMGILLADLVRFGKARKAAVLLGVIALSSLVASIMNPVSGFPVLFLFSAVAAFACMREGAKGG